MINLISITNFTGKWALNPGGYRINQFNAYIAEKQDFYLKEFLGIDLYRDLETNPTNQMWLDFVNGKDYESDVTGETEHFEGFKKILVKLVYADWILDSRFFFNETGGTEPQNENSQKIGTRKLQNVSINAFNEGVHDVCRMRAFFETNEDIYTDILLFFNSLTPRGVITKTLY